MATHSIVLAWRIPGMGEPGGLPSMESHRVGHDWSNLTAAAKSELLREKTQLNRVFLKSLSLCLSPLLQKRRQKRKLPFSFVKLLPVFVYCSSHVLILKYNPICTANFIIEQAFSAWALLKLWTRWLFVVGDCAVHCGMVNSNPGLLFFTH